MSSPTRASRRLLAFAPALALLVGACAPPDDINVGLNEVHTNVVFGAATEETTTTVAAPPTTVKVSRAPAPTFIAPPPVIESTPAPPPKPAPPPAVECPSAGLFDVPPPAATEIDRRPAPGVYAFSQAGSSQRAQQPPISLPASTERTIRNVTTTPDGFSYEQVVEQLGTTTTTVYEHIATDSPDLINGSTASQDGLYIVSVTTRRPGGQTDRFDPASPGLRILPTPAQVGLSWESLAIDPVRSAAMRLTGSIRERFRIDACGELVEGWRSEVTIDVTSADSRYVVKADYIIIPQLGGLIAADKVELTGTYHGVETKQTSTTTIKRLKPVRPA